MNEQLDPAFFQKILFNLICYSSSLEAISFLGNFYIFHLIFLEHWIFACIRLMVSFPDHVYIHLMVLILSHASDYLVWMYGIVHLVDDHIVLSQTSHVDIRESLTSSVLSMSLGKVTYPFC